MSTIHHNREMYKIRRCSNESQSTIKCCDGCIEKKNINMNLVACSAEDILKQQYYIMNVVGIKKGEKYYYDIKTGNDYCIECYETLDDKTNLELR